MPTFFLVMLSLIKIPKEIYHHVVAEQWLADCLDITPA